METTKFGVDYNIIYPVYSNIRDNYDVIQSMAIEFWDKVSGELGGKKVNLIFSGSSGAMIATIFYSVMRGDSDISLVNIRKRNEKSHDRWVGDKVDWGAINIFVDDHIFEGDTLSYSYKFIGKSVSSWYGEFRFDYVVVSWVRASAFNRIEYYVKNLFYTGLVGG